MGCCSSNATIGGAYDPSSFTLALGTSSKTKYRKQDFKEKYTGSAPILVVCTDDGQMKMQNGKVFNSGNHPVEMLLPMLHFRDAGFKFDIATATGKPVVLEMWAYPKKDQAIAALHEELKGMMESPKSLAAIPSLDGYAAIFIPGGHGCMVNLPTNVPLGKLLRQAHEQSIPTVTLCHGPSALLATALEDHPFVYDGYSAMCFTDKTDVTGCKFGYIPGPMPWQCQGALEGKGLNVLNKKETGAVHVDRELITGDSPDAAHTVGVRAAPIIVQYANNKISSIAA